MIDKRFRPNDEMYSERLCIKVSKEFVEKLQKECRSRNQTMSELIRMLVWNGMEQIG